MKTMILFPSVEAKAFISFVFATETFSRWPASINMLACEVDVAYGPIESVAFPHLGQPVLTRLRQL